MTEVCVAYPALNAADEGYQIQVVADASGSATKMANDIALGPMRQAGIVERINDESPPTTNRSELR